MLRLVESEHRRFSNKLFLAALGIVTVLLLARELQPLCSTPVLKVEVGTKAFQIPAALFPSFWPDVVDRDWDVKRGITYCQEGGTQSVGGFRLQRQSLQEWRGARELALLREVYSLVVIDHPMPLLPRSVPTHPAPGLYPDHSAPRRNWFVLIPESGSPIYARCSEWPGKVFPCELKRWIGVRTAIEINAAPVIDIEAASAQWEALMHEAETAFARM